MFWTETVGRTKTPHLLFFPLLNVHTHLGQSTGTAQKKYLGRLLDKAWLWSKYRSPVNILVYNINHSWKDVPPSQVITTHVAVHWLRTRLEAESLPWLSNSATTLSDSTVLCACSLTYKWGQQQHLPITWLCLSTKHLSDSKWPFITRKDEVLNIYSV